MAGKPTLMWRVEMRALVDMVPYDWDLARKRRDRRALYYPIYPEPDRELTIIESAPDPWGGRCPQVMWNSRVLPVSFNVRDATADEEGHWDSVDRDRWLAWAGFEPLTPFSPGPTHWLGSRQMSARVRTGRTGHDPDGGGPWAR